MAYELKCEYCGKMVCKERIRNYTRFCSKDCANEAKGSVVVSCSNCGKKMRRGKNSLKRLKSKNVFCSKRCLSEYRKKQNEVICSFCGKKIFRAKSEREANKTGNFFCGFKCKSKYAKQFNVVQCVVCGKQFHKHGAEIKRYPMHCCSVKCRNKYNDKRITLICPVCKKTFCKPPSLIKDKDNVFCSVKCHDIFQTTKKLVKCEKCGKQIYKQLCYIRRSKVLFCSVGCLSKFRFKDSIVESEFEKMVKKLNVKYLRNDRSIIKPLELDFWFPDINFAVEINGVCHYAPIYGQKSLYTTKRNDKRKRKRCKSLGIKLRTVKPGDCKKETYLPRYKKVIWEIKKHAKNYGYDL